MKLGNTLRRCAAIAFGLGIMATTVVVGAGPAQAYVPGLPPCYGPSCVGKDPGIQLRGASCVHGYEDVQAAYDLETVHLAAYPGDTTVTLRYSPLCGANWARWNGSIRSLTFWVETKNGNRASGMTGQGLTYTTMVDGTQLARACLFSGFDDTQVCTGWH